MDLNMEKERESDLSVMLKEVISFENHFWQLKKKEEKIVMAFLTKTLPHWSFLNKEPFKKNTQKFILVFPIFFMYQKYIRFQYHIQTKLRLNVSDSVCFFFCSHCHTLYTQHICIIYNLFQNKIKAVRRREMDESSE